MKSFSVRSIRGGFVCLLVLITLWVGSTSTAYAQAVGWTTKASMPTERSRLSVATASNGKLYAVGGQDNSLVALAKVEEYDPATDTWTTKASMPTARMDLGVVAASNGKLYAIGGSPSLGRYLATVEEYDPATNVWTTKASMSKARSGLSVAVAANGKLYAVGGYGIVLYYLDRFGNRMYRQGSLTTVEEYDPATDAWTTRANMLSPREDFGFVTASNGKLHAIGGLGGGTGFSNSILATVDEYDPAADVWTTRASMPTARYGLGWATASNGKQYAVGGHGNIIFTLGTVEEYDPATDIWTSMANMSNPREYFGFATASNGKLYAVGGATTYGSAMAIVDEFDPTAVAPTVTPTVTPTAISTVTPTVTPTLIQLRIFIPIAPRGVNGGW